MFVLCDAATDQQGKLNLLGVFDHIWSQTTPARHPSCAVVARLRFTRIEEGDHKVKVTFADEDGNLLLPALDGSLKIQFPPDAATVTQNLILNIQGLELKEFGEYTIDLAIDGRQEASTPLYLNPIPAQA
jgi:hypothetical protein